MKSIIFKIINILVLSIYFIILGVLSYYTYKLNIIPTKYLITGIGIILIITLLILYSVFWGRNIYIKIASIILIIIMSIGLTLVTYYLNNTYHFLSNMIVKYDKLSYSVIVLKDSNYNKIKELDNKKISYLKDTYYERMLEKLSKSIKYTEDVSDNLSNIYNKLSSKEVDAIILEDSYINLANEEIEGFTDNTKIIYTFTIKVKVAKEKKDTNVVKEPFIIYISGIDQYGKINSVRGRSDVNQLLVINPNTHKILIVNTPRDYYVQLAGTTGLRDKLTHAGIYGINKSIETIQNIYNIKIDHYIRINFDTLINIVDVIGGIDIYSDKAFVPWTNKSVYVNQGWNHFNGIQALAYARERKSYKDGDHHRGRNQQQIIETIISKLTSTKTILSKYNSILNTLDGTFQTDMEMSTITKFIKNQLDKMPSWTTETVQAYGFNSWNYTYSMPYAYRWVMEPDWNSINKLKIKINEVLNEG